MFNFKKDPHTSRSALNKSSRSSSEIAKRASVSIGGKTMIGSTVVIDGNITSAEDLIIEGKVSGTITATGHEVTVGQAGQLKANINAKSVRIEGKVEGDISGGEKVIISKTGNVLGNIDAPRVTLEDGAKFKGSIEMDPDEKPAIKAVPNRKSDLFPDAVNAEKSNAS
ncbi:polymer-forming cytoskeletal protein [Porticoccaceae bacterium]|nr:polymer-forming cytoskeletal protein [Porticoccaceae bacterium]MDC1453665.1 polymer-forming cytoskeletal protein [Porticoccaceae bacterium]